MDAVLLAAGYGTRLGEIGRETPKALLPVDGRPVIDHLLPRLAELSDLSRLVVVSNDRFVDDFRAWASEVASRHSPAPFPVQVLNDGTSVPGERLGAVGDLAFAVDTTDLAGDLLVVAGDNVFEFGLGGLVERFRRHPEADGVVTVIRESDGARLRRSGVAVTDDDDRIVRLEEKPEDPPSRLSVPPLYLLRGPVAPRLRRYLEGGGDPDAPGHFISWLVEAGVVLAWRAPGPRYEVGTPESLREARRRITERAGG